MQGRSGLIGLALLAGILIVLAFQGFQLQNLEERLILQSRQLQALGESSDRLGARVAELARGGLSISDGSAPVLRGEAEYADIEVRNPERPNLLAPDTSSYANPNVPQGATLYRGWASGDPKGFNPLTENAAELSMKVEHYVLEGLSNQLTFSDPAARVQRLAWRVEGNEDYTEFIVYLRRGVKWHPAAGVDLSDERYAWLRGPHEMTASDVVFSFDMLMNPQVENGFMKSYFEDLESWEALDDYTVRFVWKQSLFKNFENVVNGIHVLPEFLWAYDENGERFPDETIGLRFNQHWYGNKGTVGTGPYRLASYTPGGTIELERNEDYWGEKPAIKRIVYSVYTDPKRTLLMLKAREIFVGGLRASQYREEIQRWEDVPKEQWPDSPFLNGDIECSLQPDFAYSYIGWNADKPIFADRLVRKAMTHAFNRREIIDEIYIGFGELAPGPQMRGSPFNDPDIPILEWDLGRAAELLAEAGWQDTNADGLLDKDLDGNGTRENFDFTLLIYANSPETAAYANVFKDDLLKIGVRMSIDSAEWSLMQKRMNEKKFDAFTGGWSISWGGDPYQLWHSSQADSANGSNRVAFRNAEADALILELRKTFDPDERIAIYRRLHRLINDAEAYTFFRVPYAAVCWWKEVKGVKFPLVRPLVDSMPWWIEEG